MREKVRGKTVAYLSLQLGRMVTMAVFVCGGGRGGGEGEGAAEGSDVAAEVAVTDWIAT